MTSEAGPGDRCIVIDAPLDVVAALIDAGAEVHEIAAEPSRLTGVASSHAATDADAIVAVIAQIGAVVTRLAVFRGPAQTFVDATLPLMPLGGVIQHDDILRVVDPVEPSTADLNLP